MFTNVVDFDNAKAVTGVDVEEKARIELKQDVIYLKIDGDFNLNKDLATFYYSLDNKIWIATGTEFKMV
jgi:hypothetical protein